MIDIKKINRKKLYKWLKEKYEQHENANLKINERDVLKMWDSEIENNNVNSLINKGRILFDIVMTSFIEKTFKSNNPITEKYNKIDGLRVLNQIKYDRNFNLRRAFLNTQFTELNDKCDYNYIYYIIFLCFKLGHIIKKNFYFIEMLLKDIDFMECLWNELINKEFVVEKYFELVFGELPVYVYNEDKTKTQEIHVKIDNIAISIWGTGFCADEAKNDCINYAFKHIKINEFYEMYLRSFNFNTYTEKLIRLIDDELISIKFLDRPNNEKKAEVYLVELECPEVTAQTFEELSEKIIKGIYDRVKYN